MHDRIKGTRGRAEAPPQLALGEFQTQLYNRSLLFFSFTLLPLPDNDFPREDMKAARRGGPS